MPIRLRLKLFLALLAPWRAIFFGGLKQNFISSYSGVRKRNQASCEAWFFDYSVPSPGGEKGRLKKPRLRSLHQRQVYFVHIDLDHGRNDVVLKVRVVLLP
jgi:hypothetical protein